MNLHKELLMPQLNKLDFRSETSNRHGIYYEMPPHKGSGYYWYYAKEDQFYISIVDVVFREDQFMEQEILSGMGVIWYSSISGEELSPYRRISCNCVRGYVSPGGTYKAIYHKGVPIHSVAINIFPAYYEKILNTRYPGEFDNSHIAFASIDGLTDFSEMILLLGQINSYRGSGTSAELYYESKVAEAVSLILEKTKKSSPNKEAAVNISMSENDKERLRVVAAYLDDHYAKEIRLEPLARIACMGITKFKYTFRKYYSCTVTEYIHNKRITHAEQMLITTSLEIKQIAQIVGYSHAGRFAALFKRKIGLTPVEYRATLKTNG